jgi:hypothetical protein
MVYQGSVSSSLARIGELFRDAIRLNAAGVILVRREMRPNRPSPDHRPFYGTGAVAVTCTCHVHLATGPKLVMSHVFGLQSYVVSAPSKT